MGLINIKFKFQSRVHINVQEAYQESKNLLQQSEELETQHLVLEREVDDLMSAWRGASATRVEAVMTRRSEQARRLSENLSIIADALYKTAQTYEEATKASG